MASCELCGTDTQLVRAVIEGTNLDVCKGCSSFGKELGQKARPVASVVKRSVTLPQELTETEAIVPDFAQLIKEAREKKGLTQKDFALSLNEKASLIHKLETGVEPSINLARKIEKALHVVLVTKIQEQYIPKDSTKVGPITIGDMIKIKIPAARKGDALSSEKDAGIFKVPKTQPSQAKGNLEQIKHRS